MRLRIAYLFTTFPVASETFLQREVRAMGTQPVDLTIHSLWGGEADWEGQAVQRFNKWTLLTLLWWLPFWVWKKPRVLLEVCRAMAHQPPRSALNALENLLGFGFALTHAHTFENLAQRPHLTHGVWATAPAAAAWLLERLIGVPYTMGAHAYDVFQHGGDWLLREKLLHARLIHTTTEATRQRLRECGAPESHVVLVRRGLDEIQPLGAPRVPGEKLHLLAVGRLVPKKGYDTLLQILRHLRDQKIVFECRIVGSGPQRDPLEAKMMELGLQGCVHFSGALPHTEVAALQRTWADIFLFTGLVAPDGDRDGLPNVIPEAMAAGIPVLTTPVAGTTEAITHGQTGFVLGAKDYSGWVDTVNRLRTNAGLRQEICLKAHAWVRQNFDVQRNAEKLADEIRHAVMGRRA